MLYIFYNISMRKKETKEKKESTVATKILATVLACSCAFSGFSIAKNIIVSNKNYLKPISQAERDAEFFDADISSMKNYSKLPGYKNLVRLKPNNNEPIYVCVDDNITPRVKKQINNSLDYVTDIFSEINSKYKFKIVNETEYKFRQFLGKTTIKYQLSSDLPETTLGLNQSYKNKSKLDEIFNNTTNNVYNLSSIILINENHFKKEMSDNQLLYTLNHELLHSFGLNDTYVGDIDTTTYMNYSHGVFAKIISPNDYRMLYAAYCEKHINKDGSINKEKLQEINEKLDKYEEYYYNHLINKMIGNDSDYNNLQNINTLDGAVTYTYGKNTYAFNVNDNEVELNIFNNNKLIQKTLGKALYFNNFVILKDFNLEKNENLNKKYYCLFKNNDKYNLIEIHSRSIFKSNYLTYFDVPEMVK